MPASDPPPDVDHTLIDFPSDRITLGQMRKREPNLFERASLEVESPAQAEGHSLYSIELRLAERAFAAAAGHPLEEGSFDREWYLEVLDDAYQRYGLSSGTHETRELVRAFEAKAAEQAKQHRNRGR